MDAALRMAFDKSSHKVRTVGHPVVVSSAAKVGLPRHGGAAFRRHSEGYYIRADVTMPCFFILYRGGPSLSFWVDVPEASPSPSSYRYEISFGRDSTRSTAVFRGGRSNCTVPHMLSRSTRSYWCLIQLPILIELQPR